MFIYPLKIASAFMLDHEGKLLILKRSKSVKSYRGYWQLPEGKINMKESPKQALIRETEEELGYKLKKIIKIGEYSYTYKLGFIPLLTVTRAIYKTDFPTQIDLSHEHSDYKWIDKSTLGSYKFLPGLLKIITELSNINT